MSEALFRLCKSYVIDLSHKSNESVTVIFLHHSSAFSYISEYSQTYRRLIVLYIHYFIYYRVVTLIMEVISLSKTTIYQRKLFHGFPQDKKLNRSTDTFHINGYTLRANDDAFLPSSLYVPLF